eukprot:CAMPEP_0198155238 /NCGR_PEP_ID=MMETSP1443-20131203/69032_1 /TAXON_ID=186043 /ORGANISM="Entomoneis sp., Strain CCMP2396" /LENGTH=728 /DNA_ID=CAMNT_0043821981 /DNA_START=475 /DNA_END=2662 /DNA_ORIENTATION=-
MGRQASDPFEIRVALLGYVSVGKTTLLNAILGGKYSEISMKRTTAAVNLFRLTFKSNEGSNKGKTGDGQQENVRGHHKTSSSAAESTLDEITRDNKAFRNSKQLQEKLFDIELDTQLLEMRENTKMVLVDIPGINEAGTSNMYKDYVSDNWHTFDCVVIVMDGRQGVNTDEQVELLKFAKGQCEAVKDVPVITLMNKIDDPDDDEQQLLIDEARSALKRIFKNPLCAKNLDDISTAVQSTESMHFSPYLIPISSIHAYIYRSACKLDLEVFKKKIDLHLVDKLGRDIFGRKWKNFDESEKFEKAYKVVRDPKESRDGLEASNFIQFLAALNFCVGGAVKQQMLIEQQIMFTASKLSPTIDYVIELKCLFNKCIKLGHSVEFSSCAADSEFQKLIPISIDAAFIEFGTNLQNPQVLAKPFDEICEYLELTQYMGTLKHKKLQLIGFAKGVVLRQIGTLLAIEPKDYPRLTAFDWIIIFGSLLRMSRRPFFDENFGIAGLLLEKRFPEVCSMPVYTESCPKCSVAFPSRDQYELSTDGKVTDGASEMYSFCCQTYFVETDRVHFCYNNNARPYEFGGCGWSCVAQKRGLHTFDGECYTVTQAKPKVNNNTIDALKYRLGSNTITSVDFGGCGSSCVAQKRSLHTPIDSCHQLVTQVKPKVNNNTIDALKYRLGSNTNNGELLNVADPALFKKYVHVPIAESPRDPKHFGHLIWRFCELLETLQETGGLEQ